MKLTLELETSFYVKLQTLAATRSSFDIEEDPIARDPEDVIAGIAKHFWFEDIDFGPARDNLVRLIEAHNILMMLKRQLHALVKSRHKYCSRRCPCNNHARYISLRDDLLCTPRYNLYQSVRLYRQYIYDELGLGYAEWSRR